MRPASNVCQCFYCKQPLGAEHKPDCVLIKKRVIVRVTIDYEIEVPADWDKSMVEFHRNEGSWCADNMIEELQALTAERCLCNRAHFEFVGDAPRGVPFLKED